MKDFNFDNKYRHGDHHMGHESRKGHNGEWDKIFLNQPEWTKQGPSWDKNFLNQPEWTKHSPSWDNKGMEGSFKPDDQQLRMLLALIEELATSIEAYIPCEEKTLMKFLLKKYFKLLGPGVKLTKTEQFIGKIFGLNWGGSCCSADATGCPYTGFKGNQFGGNQNQNNKPINNGSGGCGCQNQNKNNNYNALPPVKPIYPTNPINNGSGGCGCQNQNKNNNYNALPPVKPIYPTNPINNGSGGCGCQNQNKNGSFKGIPPVNGGCSGSNSSKTNSSPTPKNSGGCGCQGFGGIQNKKP